MIPIPDCVRSLPTFFAISLRVGGCQNEMFCHWCEFRLSCRWWDAGTSEYRLLGVMMIKPP